MTGRQVKRYIRMKTNGQGSWAGSGKSKDGAAMSKDEFPGMEKKGGKWETYKEADSIRKGKDG